MFNRLKNLQRNILSADQKDKNTTNEFIQFFNYHKAENSSTDTLQNYLIHERFQMNHFHLMSHHLRLIHAEQLIKSCSSRFLYSNMVHHSKTHVTSGYRRRWELQAPVAVIDLQNSELILEQLKGFWGATNAPIACKMHLWILKQSISSPPHSQN